MHRLCQRNLQKHTYKLFNSILMQQLENRWTGQHEILYSDVLLKHFDFGIGVDKTVSQRRR